MKASDYKHPKHKVLIFGAPKSGKTAAALQLAEHYNLLWIDVENGFATAFNKAIGISEYALQHIELLQIPDSKSNPIASETIWEIAQFKNSKLSICDKHGKINCIMCKTAKLSFTEIDFSKMDGSWIIVLDSVTQISNSVMSATLKASDRTSYTVKSEFDDYGTQGKWLEAVFSNFQACDFHVVAISHELGVEQSDGTEKILPIAGTRNFSRSFGRFWSEIIYSQVKGRKHVLGSSTTYNSAILTGSRLGIRTEDNKEGNPLLEIFTEYRKHSVVTSL